MSTFTYEYETKDTPLETYEWDNVWWEQTDRHDTKRVLYIGDSISCATRRIATAVAGNEILFDGFGTSKALDNPYFMESLHIFAKQQGPRAAVLFNNGLHGWHLQDEKQYAENYEKVLLFLLEEFKGTPLFLLLTTHILDDRDQRVCKRNEIVNALAQKYSLPVIDLYEITKDHEDLISGDGVHLQEEGYRLLAEKIVENVKSIV